MRGNFATGMKVSRRGRHDQFPSTHDQDGIARVRKIGARTFDRIALLRRDHLHVKTCT
jgi:hypothetical protein